MDWVIAWFCFVWAFILSTLKLWALMHTSSIKKIPSVFGGCKIYPTSKEIMEEIILSRFILGCVITSGLCVAKNEEDG